jgi:hypothetical protein
MFFIFYVVQCHIKGKYAISFPQLVFICPRPSDETYAIFRLLCIMYNFGFWGLATLYALQLAPSEERNACPTYRKTGPLFSHHDETIAVVFQFRSLQSHRNLPQPINFAVLKLFCRRRPLWWPARIGILLPVLSTPGPTTFPIAVVPYDAPLQWHCVALSSEGKWTDLYSHRDLRVGPHTPPTSLTLMMPTAMNAKTL